MLINKATNKKAATITRYQNVIEKFVFHVQINAISDMIQMTAHCRCTLTLVIILRNSIARATTSVGDSFIRSN